MIFWYQEKQSVSTGLLWEAFTGPA